MFSFRQWSLCGVAICLLFTLSCSSGTPGNSDGNGDGDGITTTTPVSFDFSNAVGLALTDDSVSSRLSARAQSSGSEVAVTDTGDSNLMKVSSSGELESVVSSGSLSVSKFLISPDGKIYLFLQSAITPGTTSSPDGTCILLSVDPDSGDYSCVDEDVTQIFWNDPTNYTVPNNPIQFDGDGNLYYLFSDDTGKTVLRRNASGTKTDLISDNITINDFLVLSDGTVILTGSTTSSSVQWIRKLSASNSLSNLFSSSQANFLKRFPDGNVYMGIWSTPVFGIARYLSGTGALEDQKWMTMDINGLTEPRYYDCNDFPSIGTGGYCGSSIRGIHTTSDGKVYVAALRGSGEGALMQYYPAVSEATTVVTKVTVMSGALTNVIVAGLDDSDQNRLFLYNTTNDTEIDLLGGQEIEVYHVSFRASDNILMFDGLRFSDNKYVICQVDFSNGNALSCAATGSSQLVNFQTF